jgi:hypothetical protein
MSRPVTREQQLVTLQKRAAQVRAQAAVRRWEYRQRHHSKGVWDRLRGVLARTEVAYAVSDEVATRLIAEGSRPESVGQELHPPKTLIFASAQRAGQIPTRRAIPVRLGEQFLAAQGVLLIPFGDSE